jgi:hypothetical protein
MRDRKSAGPSDTSVVIGPKIHPHYPFPFVLPLGLGPARPEPEGGWKVPLGPLDETEGAAGDSAAETSSGRASGWWRRFTRRG